MSKHLLLLLVLAVFVLPSCVTQSSDRTLAGHFFEEMVYLKDATSARESSWNRSGRNTDFVGIASGESLEIANISGAGCIRHIYFTTIGAPEHFLRDVVIRMYWDGEQAPSVEVPFGDFFGLGHERPVYFRSLMVAVNEGSSGVTGSIGYNSYFPMPFAAGARITLTNDGERRLEAIWYHVDYEKLKGLDNEAGRFHAQWRRENLTTPVGDKINTALHRSVNPDGKENYVILEAQGHGNFAGYFLNVDNVAGGWYGEGDDMIFIDGEQWPPSFHGTGTEEIFGGGAGPNLAYAGPYTGFHITGNKNYAGKTSMFRFFVTAPVRFRKSIRVTIEHGHANNFANDYSSTAFWYQSEPHAPFPKLLSAADRRPRTNDDPFDQAYVKHAYVLGLSKRAKAVHKRTGKGLSPKEAAVFSENLAKTQKALNVGEYKQAVEAADKCIAVMAPFLDAAEKK
ncbi:MAG: glycoside hydrolase family 172 protein [Planctomycetota bacterium]|jgi:hypothetical protein